MKRPSLLQLILFAALLLSACAPISVPLNLPTVAPTRVPPATLPVELRPSPTAAGASPSGLTPETVVLSWQRQGGIAGFCDQVIVHLNGAFTVGTCRQPESFSAQLTTENLGQLTGWVTRLHSFHHVQSDPAVADGMTITLDFVGIGAGQAGEADRSAMGVFAAQLIPAISLTPVSGGGYPAVVFKAREALAAQMKLNVEQIEILTVEPVDWPDTCLGVSTPEIMCAMMITPGYRVLLRANGSDYEYHTDGGDSVVLASLRPSINP